MSKTCKWEVKKLRAGMRIHLPAQTVIVRLIHNVETPTLEENLRLIEVSGLKGPFKGKKTEFTAWENDKVDLLLKNPPLRRAFDAMVKWLWGTR